jgi:acetolactate synthase-1/2/3 large subunit
MKVSDYIAEYIESKGVKFIFELSGGMITHLLDSISQKTSIGIITMHHEQSAAFAADGYGRVTGIPGVALATSGPGATNLLTGIGSCYFDSSPAIFITGQVNRHEQKGNRKIRQLGFQETDIVSMAQHITKKSFRVENPENIPSIFSEAFNIATEGRPGPVLIDIPMDVQRADISILNIEEKKKPVTKSFGNVLEKMSDEIKKSKKPVLLVGRGIKSSFANAQFEAFIKLTKIPVVTSLLAIDAIPYQHPQRIGFIGSYGNRWANIAFGESDLLIVAGSRLDIRQTGADTNFFENRPIYHLDCEEEEINNRVKNCIPIVGNVKEVLAEFNDRFKNESYHIKAEWYEYFEQLKHQWPDTNEISVAGINPNLFIHSLSRKSEKASAYLADVGSHQMWAAQSLEIGKDQIFLTSAGMGAMGFALPASVGVCFASERKPVVVIIGDGCMQLNIQELQTIVRNELPIKVIVLNNENLGMIRQFQDSYFNSRYQSTWWGYSVPDFEKVSIAYGINAKTIIHESEVDDAINWLWYDENSNKPLLLQVMIDPKANALPKIAFGKPITEMEPFSKPLDMEGT